MTAIPYARGIGWPQDMVRRAAKALHEHRASNDSMVLAAVALRAAINTADHVQELLAANKKPGATDADHLIDQ
jgi:hypothetical protein